jgi:hypothetical protein
MSNTNVPYTTIHQQDLMRLLEIVTNLWNDAYKPYSNLEKHDEL